MTIQLTAEQEARLAEIAARAGRPIDDLAREAVDRYIAEDAHFLRIYHGARDWPEEP